MKGLPAASECFELHTASLPLFLSGGVGSLIRTSHSSGSTEKKGVRDESTTQEVGPREQEQKGVRDEFSKPRRIEQEGGRDGRQNGVGDEFCAAGHPLSTSASICGGMRHLRRRAGWEARRGQRRISCTASRPQAPPLTRARACSN